MDMESFVGIRHYATTGKGLGGEIKKRIEDFIVEEITSEGEVLPAKVFTTPQEEETLPIPKTRKRKANYERHTQFTLEKFNHSTLDAVKAITNSLRVSGNRIGYSGMKDKRAVTTQRMSIFGVDREALGKLKFEYLDIRDPHTGPRIELGQHYGNRFTTTIRGIEFGVEEAKEKALGIIEECSKGLINYFGPQRFGDSRPVTHLVGREIVKGDFEGAVMTYLSKTFDGEREETRKARERLAEEMDFKEALKYFPAHLRFEKAVLNRLVKDKGDFIGALRELPKNLQVMFIHGYQAYLFNEIANKHYEMTGFEEMKGDIVIKKEVFLPLVGWMTPSLRGELGEIAEGILAEECITREDFKIKTIEEMSSKGEVRRLRLVPQALRLAEVGEDEMSGKMKMTLRFILEKGMYATVVLREFMKN